MAYNENLAARVRTALKGAGRLEEKKMMGGLTFMLNARMCVGVLKDDLMCRIDPTQHDAVLKKKGCREMDFTGRPMKGFVFVGPKGTDAKKDLDYWVALSVEFNGQLKAKKPSRKKKGSR